jgi:hypothetical protein
VISYDVQVSLNGADYVDWLNATTETSATYNGTRGNRYQFRVRARDGFDNVSTYLSSDLVTIGAPPTEPGGGPRPGRTLEPANVALLRSTRSPSALLVRGLIHPAATGTITLTWTAARRHTARAGARVRNGVFSARLRIPRRARKIKRAALAIRYAGDGRFAPETKHVTLRSR